MASKGSENTPAQALRPVIGLTTYQEQARALVWDTEFALLQQAYVDAVARAGGVAVLLPPQPGGAREAVARLDGLILTGGPDVGPEHYHADRQAATRMVRPPRDDWELRLLDLALAADLPVLGVCRGAQLLNVALGGSLDQHLPDTVGHLRHGPGPGVFGRIPVRLKPDSVVGALLGPQVHVSCHHHQALAGIAPALQVCGLADDGTVEAVELPERRFAVGVQWHPEQDSDDLRLFEALVRQGRTR